MTTAVPRRTRANAAAIKAARSAPVKASPPEPEAGVVVAAAAGFSRSITNEAVLVPPLALGPVAVIVLLGPSVAVTAGLPSMEMLGSVAERERVMMPLALAGVVSTVDPPKEMVTEALALNAHEAGFDTEALTAVLPLSVIVWLTEQLVFEGPLGDVVAVVPAAPAEAEVAKSRPAEPATIATAPPSRTSAERIPTMCFLV